MTSLPTHWLIDTAAAVTLLIALVLLLRGPVARHFGPSVAYALWVLPLFRAVLPPVTLTVEVPAGRPVEALALPIGTSLASAAAPTIDWTLLISSLWLAGAVAMTVHAVASYAALRRAIGRDASLIDMAGRVAIVESSAVDGPVAIGVLRPLVVLPRDFAATFSPDEQRHVIAHELEHHRGHDLVFNLAAFALLALNWFNPIAWVGWRAFRQDQEAACDGRTLARTGGDRASYGRAIAAAVAGPLIRPAAGPTPAFALAMGEKSALIHRLRSLNMTDINPGRRLMGRGAIALATVIALPLTASVSYAVVQAEPAAPVTPPAPPAPPASPLPPEVDVEAGPGEFVRTIQRDGRTIILRTDRELSDAEAEAMVAEAEASRAAAEAEIAADQSAAAAEQAAAAGAAHAEAAASANAHQREIRRITIRSRQRQSGDSAAPVPPVPPVPPARPGAAVRGESTFVFRHDGAPGYGDIRTSCDNDPDADRIERTTGEGNSQHTLRIVRCGGSNEPAIRLSALRAARHSLAAMRSEHLPAEARRSAIAELDSLIAELERGSGG